MIGAIAHRTVSAKTSQTLSNVQQGFSLLETIVSLLILLAALSGIIPLYLISRLQVIEGEIETGAIAVSEQVLENLRKEFNDVDDIDLIPSNGQPQTVLPASDQSIATISHMGKEYKPTITYCETPKYCDTYSRHIKIQVNFNGENVYETETIYTKLESELE